MPTLSARAPSAKPTFECDYQGETTYRWQGESYAVRYSAHDYGDYDGDHFERGILPSCGTVRCEHGSTTKYPPAAILEHFPGYCLARYDRVADSIEYPEGQRPAIVTEHFSAKPHYVARGWLVCMADYYRESIAIGWPDRHTNPDYVKRLIGEYRHYRQLLNRDPLAVALDSVDGEIELTE